SGAAFDVLQAGANVLIDDLTAGGLDRIDPGLVAINGHLDQGELELSHGSDVVAIADPNEGNVWVVPVDRLSAFDPSIDPLVTDLPGVRVVTGADGTVHVVAPGGDVQTVRQAGDEGWQVEAGRALDAALLGGEHAGRLRARWRVRRRCARLVCRVAAAHPRRDQIVTQSIRSMGWTRGEGDSRINLND
ncbi:MAG: hypothetical protein ACK5LS_09325, partial [Propioniciclava sp.]